MNSGTNRPRALLGLVALSLGAGCGTLLGADFDRAAATQADGGATTETTSVPADSTLPADGCAAGKKACGGACADVDDPAFGCGATTCSPCDVSRGIGVCQGGACAVASCAGGRADCNHRADDGCEVNTSTNPAHCGSCGVACASDQVCGPAGCAKDCPSNLAKCAQSCVDLEGDEANCGACGRACTAPVNGDATCAAHACGFVCRSGFTPCGGACCSSAPKFARAIATGLGFTCILTTTDAVECFGDNSSGQLGDGTTIERHTPIVASGLGSGVASIAAGATHACALTKAGALLCWGRNYYGQVGDGTNTERWVPVAVSGLSSGVTAVTAGNVETCAIVNGGVRCWGANGDGELGNNSTTGSFVPVAVSGLPSGVASIAAAVETSVYGHVCALTTAGAVKCWGDNFNGRLGANLIDGTSLVPAVVSGLSSGVTALSQAGGAACAILAGPGELRCWGYNAAGQLGDSTTTSRSVPVSVTGLSAGVTQVGTGSAHSCALLGTGAVRCWGSNLYGQLGNNSSSDAYTPQSVAGMSSGITAIAASGEAHNCALNAAGGVRCWGSNQYGQLGDGTVINRRVPTEVTGY